MMPELDSGQGVSNMSIDELSRLAGSSDRDIERWLADNRPAADDQRHWWEEQATRAFQHIYATPLDRPSEEWIGFARLVARLSEGAVEVGALPPVDAAVRLLYLRANCGERTGYDAEVIGEPDSLVRHALGLIAVSLDEAKAVRAEWTKLPVEEIAKLRTAKNIVSAALHLERLVQDSTLRKKLAQWAEIKDQLP